METNHTIQERVFAAAEELSAECGNALPTVDAVRRRARVNMNDANSYMKEWRQKRTPASASAAVQLPADLQVTCTAALAQLWQQAVSLANEPLRAAHAGWELERVRANEAEQELLAAFELQSAELTAANDEIARLSQQVTELAREIADKSQALITAEQDRTASQHAAREAEIRLEEIDRKAGELRKELDHAHANIAILRQSHSDEIAQLAAEATNEVQRERELAEQERLRYGTSLLAGQAEIAKLLESLHRSEPASKAVARKPKAAIGDDATPGQNMTLPNV